MLYVLRGPVRHGSPSRSVVVEHEAEQEDIGLVQWSDDLLSAMRARVQRFDARVRRTLRERPVLSLLSAAAFGCALGRVMSRR